MLELLGLVIFRPKVVKEMMESNFLMDPIPVEDHVDEVEVEVERLKDFINFK